MTAPAATRTPAAAPPPDPRWLVERRSLYRLVKAKRLGGWFAAARYAVARRLRIKRMRLTLRGWGRSVVLRPKSPDLHTLYAVFYAHECRPPALDPPPRVILDGGANAGYTALYLATLFPDAAVVAVEPGDENTAMARENLAGLGHVQWVQAGLWDRDTLLKIANPDAPPDAYQLTPCDDSAQAVIDARTIDRVLSEAGHPQVDLVKLDIEGAERQVFSDPTPHWLDSARVLMIEVHGPDCQAAVEQAMQRRGFARSQQGEKLVYQRKGHSG